MRRQRSPEKVSLYNRNYHAANRSVINARHRLARQQRKVSPERDIWLCKKLLADARRRAHRRKIAFDITIADIDVPKRCPIFGAKLIWNAGRRRADSPSLDRIDASRGYVRDNVWVISWRANQIKSDATPAELRRIAEAVESRVGKQAAGRLLDGREWSEMPR